MPEGMTLLETEVLNQKMTLAPHGQRVIALTDGERAICRAVEKQLSAMRVRLHELENKE
jgi:hypothetical protein